MKNPAIKTSQKLLLNRYAFGLAAGWTLVVCLLVLFNVRHEQWQAEQTALTQARWTFQRDTIYRHWNAKYGPVYVLINKGVTPNPYLSGAKDRDVTTTSGEKLTMVNPAYMTRLVFELAARDYGVKGHITSLRPIRPENRPDPWESKALEAFELGTEEVSSVQQIEGVSYLRMIRPLKLEQECLKCHERHGSEARQIRGGISIAVPMEPLYRISRKKILVSVLSMTFLGLIGLAGILAGAAQMHRTIRQRDRAEMEISLLNQDLLMRKTELEAANQELEAFSFTVSHDLRSPLLTVGGFCNRIRKIPPEKHLQKCDEYTGIISRECARMERLIADLLDFSRLSRGEIKRESVSLSNLAADIAAGLRVSDPARSVTFRIEEGVKASGDPALLRVVMQNLLGNAWKYTGKKNEAEIEFGIMRREGEPIYFVRDNGAGFDTEQGDRIFEAFHRLDSAKDFEGIGIGLATVKRIITRHSGRVWAEGKAGEGATFYFTLP